MLPNERKNFYWKCWMFGKKSIFKKKKKLCTKSLLCTRIGNLLWKMWSMLFLRKIITIKLAIRSIALCIYVYAKRKTVNRRKTSCEWKTECKYHKREWRREGKTKQWKAIKKSSIDMTVGKQKRRRRPSKDRR